MSESTQTSQADLWDVKRCSCVVFSKKQEEKLDKQAWSSLHPPPPPPRPPHCFCRVARGFSYLVYPNSAFFRRKGSIGGGGGGWEERTLGLFVKSFLPAFRKKTTQEHLFTLHRSACEVWVDSDILENFEMAVTWFLPGAIQLFLSWLYVMIFTTLPTVNTVCLDSQEAALCCSPALKTQCLCLTWILLIFICQCLESVNKRTAVPAWWFLCWVQAFWSTSPEHKFTKVGVPTVMPWPNKVEPRYLELSRGSRNSSR